MTAVESDVKLTEPYRLPSRWHNRDFHQLCSAQVVSLACVIAISAVAATFSKGMRNVRPLDEMAATA